jgi:transcriptional regulator GlxA family with amidase domain
MNAKRKKRIGFLVYDGLQALDLFGPQEVFAEANRFGSNKASEYETIIISENGEAVTTESGVAIGAHTSLNACPSLHTLLIPGGAGSRQEKIPEAVVDWVRMQTPDVSRIGSICTGIFILARTGILDGRPVTTHWHHVEEALASFPTLQIKPDALFVRDGSVITAAGITAGIDMALSLVEEDMGARVASNVARELVVFLRRPGGQDQFSSLLRQQAAVNNRFSDLLVWIAENLTGELSTDVLAARVCLSERHFRRAFKNNVGETPARAVERIRMEAAKDWLTSTRLSISEVSRITGFRSPDAFRRAFERLTGVNPTDYRQRFGVSDAATAIAGRIE